MIINNYIFLFLGAGIQFRLGSSAYESIFENVRVYDSILGKVNLEVQGEEIYLGKSGLLLLFPGCRYNF